MGSPVHDRVHPMYDAFMSLLAGGIPDRVVWAADLNYWMEGERRAGRGDPAWETEEGYLDLHRSLGVFPYYYYGKFWLAAPRYDSSIEIHTERADGCTITRYHTPVGTLTSAAEFLPISISTGVTKHFVESENDLDVLIYIVEHRRLVPACLDDYPERLTLWRGAGGVPSIALLRCPLSSLAYEWAGVQQTAYLLADCRSKVDGLFRLMEEQEAPILDAVCRVAPPIVHFADNLSSDNFTGLYDRYMGPVHRRRIERLHTAGVRCAVHLDGRVKGLLPKLARAGFDAVEALTPRPAGDLDACEMRAVAGTDRLILWGGVPGVMFAPPFTWRDMEEHVRYVLRQWRGQPFILGVADQVPPDGDITFCRRIADLLETPA
jgi:hypothetical protein